MGLYRHDICHDGVYPAASFGQVAPLLSAYLCGIAYLTLKIYRREGWDSQAKFEYMLLPMVWRTYIALSTLPQVFARITRSSMIEVYTLKLFVRTAKAKGLPVRKHL